MHQLFEYTYMQILLSDMAGEEEQRKKVTLQSDLFAYLSHSILPGQEHVSGELLALGRDDLLPGSEVIVQLADPPPIQSPEQVAILTPGCRIGGQLTPIFFLCFSSYVS